MARVEIKKESKIHPEMEDIKPIIKPKYIKHGTIIDLENYISKYLNMTKQIVLIRTTIPQTLRSMMLKKPTEKR
jgi:hypothetical protein